jgi:hypothetical protein
MPGMRYSDSGTTPNVYPSYRPRSRSFKLSKPNGKNWWKIEGRLTGKRERYYFASQKEAKKGAADRNNQIAAFGSQNPLPDSDRVMASECIRTLSEYGKTLYDATNFYRDYLERQASSIDVADLCDRIVDEFERRYEAEEISRSHHTSMRETVKKFRGQFAERPILPSWFSRFKMFRRKPG